MGDRGYGYSLVRKMREGEWEEDEREPEGLYPTDPKKLRKDRDPVRLSRTGSKGSVGRGRIRTSLEEKGH